MEGGEKSVWLTARASGYQRGWSVSLVRTCGVLSGLVEERESSYVAVQDVVGEVSSSEARAARHGGISTESVVILSRKRLPTPFLSRGAFEMGDPFFCPCAVSFLSDGVPLESFVSKLLKGKFGQSLSVPSLFL